MPKSAPSAMYCKSDIKFDELVEPSLPSDGSGEGRSYKGAGAAFEGDEAEGAEVRRSDALIPIN